MNFFHESQMCLSLPKLQGEWVLAIGAVNYEVVFESKPIRFEAGMLVRRRKRQFRVLVWHARNHFTIINEL